METVPLAHDADGNAFPLPDEAAFWRVRRHTGGRPSIVLGPDGEPLFISINADVSTLEQAGCGSGAFRLEAVDVHRKVVGAPIAFVDIADVAPQPLGNGDVVRAAMEALTRTTEAMQRAQVERERAQAARDRELMQAQIEAQRAMIENQKVQMNMVVQLFERVTGHGDPVAMLQQQLKFQRELEAEAKRRNSRGVEKEKPAWAETLEKLNDQYGPVLFAAVAQKLGLPVQFVPAAPAQADADEDDEEDDDEDEEREADAQSAEEAAPESKRAKADAIADQIAEKVSAVEAKLTLEEREQLHQMRSEMPQEAAGRAAMWLAGMPVDEAVRYVRRELLKRSRRNGAASQPEGEAP